MSSATPFQQQLINAIEKASNEQGVAWLGEGIELLRNTDDINEQLMTLSAMARRKLGNEPFPDQALAIDTGQATLHLGHWRVGDAGRIVLLMEACRRQPGDDRWERRMFRAGDETERAAIIQALLLLDRPQDLKPLALEAGRANSLELFGSMALNNPYPALYYSEHEFNQVVLKSLFVGLPVSRIQGLQERANAELSKMCEDYIDEREAAYRSVPVDIWLAVAPHATEHGEALIQRYLDHQEPHHRYFTAKALMLSGKSSALGDIEARLQQEQVDVVRNVLSQALHQPG